MVNKGHISHFALAFLVEQHPPGRDIHQNFISNAVRAFSDEEGSPVLFPDSCVHRRPAILRDGSEGIGIGYGNV